MKKFFDVYVEVTPNQMVCTDNVHCDIFQVKKRAICGDLACPKQYQDDMTCYVCVDNHWPDYEKDGYRIIKAKLMIDE